MRQHRRASERRVSQLAERYDGVSGIEIVRPIIEVEFRGGIAVVSSFGTEAAVLLDLVAEINRTTPVIFLETGNHFRETLAYRDELVARLGLTHVRCVTPDSNHLKIEDPNGDLARHNPDHCCHLRKVLPLERALNGFDAWMTGRKRYQGDVRADLPIIEAADGRVKINPLAGWSPADIDDWMTSRDLPRHPLAKLGYLSIGCAPCTEMTTSLANPRSGRWAGTEKTECGIHRANLVR